MIFTALLPLIALLAANVQAGKLNERAEEGIGGVLAGGYVNNITVSADNVVQCAEATISWTGTSDGPVTLTIGQGGYYVGRTDVQTIPSISSNSYQWKVNQPSGQDLIFEITDSKGAKNYVQNVKVGASDDSSCLANAPSPSSSAANGGEGGQSASVVEITTTVPASSPSSSESPSTSTSLTDESSTSISTPPSSSSDSNSVVSASVPPTTISVASSSPTLSSNNAASPASASISGSGASSGVANAPLAAASGGNTTSSSPSQFPINLGLVLGVLGAVLGGRMLM